MRAAPVVLFTLAVTCALAAPVAAFEDMIPVEATGMGGASRAWAVADQGPLLNPSGMSLTKAYTLTGAYAYTNRASDQFLHASVVDSTSPFNLAGGLYYTYHALSPSGGVDGHGHEAGLALSFPFGPFLSLGATAKYFNFQGADAFGGHDGGVTFDVGATIRPVSTVSIGLVGTNLRDLGTSEAGRSLGYGIALIPLTGMVVAADGVTHLTADAWTGRKGTSVMGGMQYTLAKKVGLRAGGGYDATTGAGYLTVGLSGVSQVGAIDVGLRQDLSRSVLVAGQGERRETMLGISLRLFVPAMQTEDTSLETQDIRAPVKNP